MRQFKNILLLYPETPKDTYWSFTHALRMIGKKVSTPPLGLLTVAAMLPREEFDLRLVDMNATELRDADLAWADIVFVSSMIAHKDSLETVLPRLKAAGKIVVSGGPYTTTAYAETDNVDCFFIGEAEAVWDSFLTDLRAGTLRPAYGAAVRDEEVDRLRSHFGPEALIVRAVDYPDINLAPLPRFDLLDLKQYSLMPVQASRGCPVGCEFCDIWRRYGRKPRNKLYDRMLAEMEELYRLGWRDTVFLVDDNFIGNKVRAKELLRELIVWQEAHDRPFPFLTESTLSMADDDELLELMEAAGFNSVFVGIETPAHESLKETRKHINTTGSMADKVAKIQARGIQLMSGFIIGFDADPDDIAERMTACIQEMGIPQAMIGLLTALPDTDLHDRLEQEGRVRGKTSGNNTHGFTMNFVPTRPEERVVGDYKQVLDAAYSRNLKGFFERCTVLRGRWPGRRRHAFGRMPVRMQLRALGMYLWAALRSPYRVSAYKFLLSTLVTKPSFFAEAVTLGVKGHHLWAITRNAFEVESMREFMMERLRGYGVFLQGRRAQLGEMLARAGAQLNIKSGDLAEAWSGIRRSVNLDGASEELRSAYHRAEEILREIENYQRRVRGDVQREFANMSRSARASLRQDMERFTAELDLMLAGLRLEPALA